MIESKSDTIAVNVQSTSSTKVSYQFILTPNSNAQTQLTWNVNTILNWYSWEKVKGIFLDKISGPRYEAALISLKKSVEK